MAAPSCLAALQSRLARAIASTLKISMSCTSSVWISGAGFQFHSDEPNRQAIAVITTLSSLPAAHILKGILLAYRKKLTWAEAVFVVAQRKAEEQPALPKGVLSEDQASPTYQAARRIQSHYRGYVVRKVGRPS